MSESETPPAATASRTQNVAKDASHGLPATARGVFATIAAYLIGVAFGSSLSHLNLI